MVPACIFEAFFLPAAHGQRFCIYHAPPPGTPLRGALVYLHPFAEEMNRSRRMAALQARAFAAEGYAVLGVDLLGCGDSSGDFGDVTWADWLDDVVLAYCWLQQRVGIDVPLWLWGLRAGALLAIDAMRRDALQSVAGLLLWQPVLDGARHLDQFLRLKLVGDLLRGEVASGVAALRQRVQAGEAVEVAGYCLNPELVAGLDAVRAEIDVRSSQPLRIECIELSSRLPSEQTAVSPGLLGRIESWSASGLAAYARAVPGPGFWQTVEIAEAPALIPATLASVRGMA